MKLFKTLLNCFADTCVDSCDWATTTRLPVRTRAIRVFSSWQYFLFYTSLGCVADACPIFRRWLLRYAALNDNANRWQIWAWEILDHTLGEFRTTPDLWHRFFGRPANSLTQRKPKR